MGRWSVAEGWQWYAAAPFFLRHGIPDDGNLAGALDAAQFCAEQQNFVLRHPMTKLLIS
jgi:hypothetical protein